MDKYLVPIIVAVISGNSIWAFIQFLISRKDKKKDDIVKLFDDVHSILDRLDSIQKEVKEIKTELKINTKGTKANLYTELDKWIEKMKLIGCWSSETRERFEEVFDVYEELGNGKGDTLLQRANSIPIDNITFHEKLSRYNKHKMAVMNGEI